MSKENVLKAAEQKVFKMMFKDGLLDIFLAAFLLIFALAPLLSVKMGDFWSSFIFLPFWGVVYLILRFLHGKVVKPRLGSVEWGNKRKKKLWTGQITMLIINGVFLVLGIITFVLPIVNPWNISILFALMMLILFTAAGLFLDYTSLYIYGLLIALAVPIGDWLYSNAGFTHHGFPVVFGTIAGIIFIRGLVKFISFLNKTPNLTEEYTGK